MINYSVSDLVTAIEFIELANSIWLRDYDEVQIEIALTNTMNMTARDDTRLIGCLRILSDGYLFGTIPEILIHPDYQKQGVGCELFNLAKIHSPTSLYFGAQPEAEGFYNRLGINKGIQSFEIKKS